MVNTYCVNVFRPTRDDPFFRNIQKRERKRIKLRKNLKPSTDVYKLAGDVMKKCKYVHASKREELERVIQELQHQVAATFCR